MHEMTIADLGEALRGVSRDSVILIDTPDGPLRLRSLVLTRVAGGQGDELALHPAAERPAIVLRTWE